MPKIVTLEANAQFADVLEAICVSLQITPTQFKSANEKYAAVGDWLGKEDSPLATYYPHIFPQGSLHLDTTVKPRGQNEFDLDAVCKLYITGRPDPQVVFDMVWNRLYANKTYRPLIDRKRRCVRVNYANEFHLDVVPAIPDWSSSDENWIKIPDIPNPTLKDWKASNPIGYAVWFELRTRKLVKMAEARIDPLRHPRPVHLKATLKRSVQLFKRWRDIHFADCMELSPPSIILTTLAAELHQGEEWCSDALATILTKIEAMTRHQKPKLYNPVHKGELISERWEGKDGDDAFEAFRHGIKDFHERWLDLIHSSGLPEIAKELEALFGEPAVRAFKEAAKPVSAARLASGLYVTKGTRTLTEVRGAETYRVEQNHFYGD